MLQILNQAPVLSIVLLPQLSHGAGGVLKKSL